MTKKLKKDLQAVNKELKALAKKVDGIIIAVDKLEEPKTTKKLKAKPVKAKTVKKTVAKKIVVKKPAAKKPAKTAADTVLAIMNRYKKGVGTAALMEKTGYNQKKISNLVFKLRKQSKIKSVGRGVYVKS